MALRTRREERSLHAYHSLVSMQLDGIARSLLEDLFYTRSKELRKDFGERISKCSVCYHASAIKKAGLTDSFGTINDLVGDDEISWTNVFTEGTDCRKGKDGFHPEVFKCGYIGCKGDRRGLVRMVFPVAGYECNLLACWETRNGYWRRWKSPRL